ncbi:MAG: type II secretion system minor pseudopilin GspJ [Burkholderiales bacterium]
MKSRHRGFTLIEVLIAITLFAVMSGLAYRGLASILNAKERVTQENVKWRGVAMFFARLENDLLAAVPRPIRDSNNLQAEAFIAKAVFSKESEGQLMFTRMGLPGTEGVLAAPQRYGYRLKDRTIETMVWPVLDQGKRTVPAIYPVLEGVTALKLRYLNAANQWVEGWPVGVANPAISAQLPKAVEVSLTLESGEELTRLMLVNS